MYNAYYRLRQDGNGELCALIADKETIDEILAANLRIVVEGRLNFLLGSDKWFKIYFDCPEVPGIYIVSPVDENSQCPSGR